MVNIGKNKMASPKIIILQLKWFAKYSFEIVLAQKPKLNQFQKETKPYQTGHMLFREHENNPKNYQNGYGEAQFNSISLQETTIIERIKRKNWHESYWW